VAEGHVPTVGIIEIQIDDDGMNLLFILPNLLQ